METEVTQKGPIGEGVEEPGEQLYIGSKLIRATVMDEATFTDSVKGKTMPDTQENRPGYKVTYPDGYVSWSPKEAFETAYREVTASEKELF